MGRCALPVLAPMIRGLVTTRIYILKKPETSSRFHCTPILSTMHNQALVLMFLGLWAAADCIPLNAGMIASPWQESRVGAKAQGTAASRQLVESSPIQPAEKRNQESLLRHANAEIRKREDNDGLIVNEVVAYANDEITKREDNGALGTNIIKYTDDEITKRGDGKGTIANNVVL